MISIDNLIEELVTQPHKKNLQLFDGIAGTVDKFKEQRPTELRLFKDHMSRITGFRDQLKEAGKFNLTLDAVSQSITNTISEMTERWMDQKDVEYQQIDQQVESLKLQIEQENKLHNQQIRQSNTDENANFVMLEAKRKELESYSDRIFDICSQWGISTSDVDMDASMFTPQELSNLYDDYLKYVKKDVEGKNIITMMKNKIPNVTVQGVIILVLLILCFTQILDFLAIAFFGALIVNQIKNKNRLKYYSILMGITFNIKPEELGYVAFDDSRLLPEELTDEMMDNDERFAQFETMYDEVEQKYAPDDPSLLQAQLLNEFGMRRAEFDKMLKDMQAEHEAKCNKILQDIADEIDWLNKEYERLKALFKTLGNNFSQHLYFKEDFVLGLHDDCIEEVVSVGLRNMVIRPSHDEKVFNKFMQALYVNAISNVWPGRLTVYVYDPNGFGRTFTPFFQQSLSRLLIFENSELGPILEKLTNEVQENFKTMGSLTIQEFNKDCEATGKTPKDYSLLIIMSQPKTVEEDEKLTNFFEYSATGGCFIWVVSNEMTPNNAFIFNAPFENIPNPLIDTINEDWCKKVSDNYVEAVENAKPKGLLWADFINNVLPLEKTWKGDASKFLDFYPGYEDGDPGKHQAFTLGNEGNVHAIGVGTSGAGKSVFLNHIVGTMCRQFDPSQLELWLCDFKGVEFKAYMKTPRAKAARLCKPVRAGDGYMVKKDEKTQEVLGYYAHNKETGEYTFSAEPTPDCNELHVFMQDLDKKTKKPKMKKGVEIPPRPKSDTQYEPNMESYCLPHIAACLCTSDGDFATSLFKAYRNKADQRYDDMKILGVKNMPGWNSRVKTLLGSPKPPEIVDAHGKEEGFNPMWSEDDLWPRVLFICDEFQVIFQKADPNNVEEIKKDITQIAKVARACGMHIFFTSQSMKGTISSDILANFTLRFALRCEAEVSQDIIGSTRAAEIREKNGYLIVQSQEMKTAADQKRFKTPFLCDDENSGKDTTSELFDNIRFLYNKAASEDEFKKFANRDVIAYEEATKHPIQQLIDLYQRPEVVSKLPESGVFFLGMRMAYSTNKLPDNFVLGAQNNTHIFSCFTDYKDLAMFFMTIVTNIKNNKVPGTVVINSQIEDLAVITDAEQYITHDMHKHLLSSRVEPAEVIDWIMTLKQKREEANDRSKPTWIILMGWDKGKGIGVEPDPSIRAKLNNLLQMAGEWNIHIIMINSGVGSIAMSTVEACKHRIAGKCSNDESQMVLGNRQASKSYEMSTGWLFSYVGGKITRDKLFIADVDLDKLSKSEIVMT